MADHGSKRGKPKKNAAPINTSKQIEDTIAQLERSKAGDKEQDIEIGASFTPYTDSIYLNYLTCLTRQAFRLTTEQNAR